MSPHPNIVLTMDIADLLITLLAIPIVASTAFIFGRNPYRWALYAYFIKFWCLIPLFMLSKRETPPFPKWIQQLAAEVNTRKELREVKKVNTPSDLLERGGKS
jgi:glucose-6-phosphate isomerase